MTEKKATDLITEDPSGKQFIVLTKEEVAWLRRKKAHEEAMGMFAQRLRTWVSIITMVIGGYFLLFEKFKEYIKGAIQ